MFKKFLKIFYPKIYVDSIYDVPYKKFIKRGIKALVFDIDNTLIAFDMPEPDDNLIEFIAKLKEMGFAICLLSNNNETRVEIFNRKLQLPAISKARKPGLSGLKKAMALTGAKNSQTALIGDQVFTDVWCGNRLSVTTVLVKPVVNRDEWTIRLKRSLEVIVIKMYLKGRQKR